MEILFKHVTKNYNTTEYENHCDFVYENYSTNTECVETSCLDNSKMCNNLWKFKNNFLGEDIFVENYSNLFCDLTLSRQTVFITKTNEKLSIKIFRYFNRRKVGMKFFKKTTSMTYLTFNFKTGSTYYGNIRNYHKKKKCVKSIRRNFFYRNYFNSILGEINMCSDYHKAELRDEIINVFKNNLTDNKEYRKYSVDEILYKLYLDKYQIKYPNNWKTFLSSTNQPNIKILRKHDMKYVESFMFVNGLSGGKIKKCLHLLDTSFNIYAFKTIVEFFGEKNIINLDETTLIKLLEFNGHLSILNSDKFTKKENECILEIFKLVLDGEIDQYTFQDHYRITERLKKYQDIKWKSTTYDEFKQEHLYFSDKLYLYTNGVFERIYPSKWLHTIHKPILDEYYPILLMNTEEYNDESTIQSNCVRNYTSKPSSIIISLRKYDPTSKTRATVEYNIFKRNNNVFFERVQSLGRFNNSLSKEWNQPLYILDERLKSLNGELTNLYRTFFTNGINTLESEAVFTKWENFYSIPPPIPLNEHFYTINEYLVVWDNPILCQILNN